MGTENKTLHEAKIQTQSGEYRFIVRDSPRSGRYLLIEDVRTKDGKSRTERIVLYPEWMEAFDTQYQKAKTLMSSGTVEQ